MLLGGGIYAGATLVIMEAFDLERSLTLVQDYGVTLYYAVPPVLVILDNYPNLSRFNLSKLRYIMVGAAPLAPEVALRVQEKMRLPILQGYGLTEA
jgi:acyl-CoA synthetase (AMP-forming)/AMP-acid ligase II